MILAGDIGGTNCRLAIFEDDAETVVEQAVIKTAGRARFEDVAAEFFRSREAYRAKIDRACFGVAGAVRDGRVSMTNVGWTLDEKSLARELKIERVALINDMVAHGENIDRLRPDQVETIRAGKKVNDGNGAVIIAGTGLGEGALYYDRATQRHRGMPSEGGHADFGPRDAREIALLEFLRDRGKPTSWEAVVSGPGLRAVYDYLATTDVAKDDRKDFGAAGPKPEEITQADDAGVCGLCSEATKMFAGLYGAEAGNLALKMCATAGVWLGGSIAKDLGKHLRGEEFLAPFQSKGPPRIREMLAKVPIHLIKFELNGLYGAADYARGM